MNVLLVDSDSDNIKNFRTYIRRSFPTMKVVGNFTKLNSDIIPVIRDTKPDLILADIKFFGGVRFMRFKEVHDQFPNIKFVVYGTFNESEYMRRARDFGVIDYMYRPVKPVELARCLNLALGNKKKAEAIQQQVKNTEERYQDNMHHYENIFLRGLSEGYINNEGEIREGLNHFKLTLGPGYTAAVIHVDHFRQIALTLTESEKHLLIYKVYQTVTEALADRQSLVFMTGFHSVCVLMSGFHSIEENVAFFDGTKQLVYSKSNVQVSIGLGRTYENITDISVSYKEAMAAFRYRNRMGYNAVIPLEFVEPANKITYRYPYEREDRLIYMAVVGDYQYCHRVLHELFDSLAQSGPMPEGLLPKILMNIVIRISRYISEQNLPIANQVARLFPASEILAVQNLEEGLKVFDKALQNFCAYVRSYAEERHQRLYRTARQYIDQNFAENFSTSRMAASLGTTPEHLNKVFTDRERVSLFDYVMHVRMNEARKLLSETDIDEEAVCTHVGFENVDYFASTFKQYEGILPSEYRENAKKAKESEESEAEAREKDSDE